MPPRDFECKQCGNCCLNLGGAFSCTVDEEDILMWELAGRYDILEWVSTIDLGEGHYIYDIWINPKTGEDVERCPWLRKLPKKDKYICRIHGVKPMHCRAYPNSVKHARETGCQGFDHLFGASDNNEDDKLFNDYNKLLFQLRVEQVNSILKDNPHNYLEEMEKIGFTWVDDGYDELEEIEEENAKPENQNQELLVEFFGGDLPVSEKIYAAFWQERNADQPNYPLFRLYFKRSNKQLKKLLLWGLNQNRSNLELLSDLAFFHQFQPNLAELIEHYMTACKIQEDLEYFTLLVQDFYDNTVLEGFDAFRALSEIFDSNTNKGAIIEYLLDKKIKNEDAVLF